MVLAQAARAARALQQRRRTRPIDYMRWVALQHQFLASHALVKQIRAGNQGIGKTTPALAEVVGRCTGQHPLGAAGPPIRTPPIEAWIVCASWSQSLGIQKKLWALLPKDLLDASTRYDIAAGFSPTKQPVVVFANGSIIRIKTTGQDSIEFAGATLDVILFDEPPTDLRVFVEALMRVQERGGVLLLSYTPINADVTYLRTLVEAGQIEDHHSRLTPEATRFVGTDEHLRDAKGAPKDAEWIAKREAMVPAHERETVVHGEWPSLSSDLHFLAPVWVPGRHVVELAAAPTDSLILGVDHGDRPGKQYAVLLALDESSLRVHALDEYCDLTGRATARDDARGILTMLVRHGITWSQLRRAAGDRIHLPGSLRQKSNDDLLVELGRALKIQPQRIRPQIVTVKRGEGHGSGSVLLGLRWLHTALAEGRFTVSQRCKRLREAIPLTTPRESPSKDPVDAVRYALEPWVYLQDPHLRGAGPELRLG